METTEKEFYIIGELLGAPVYYHKDQDENSVAISFGPVNKNPNEGRSIFVPGFVCATSSNEIQVSSDNVEILNDKIDSSKYAVSNSEQYGIVEPTGDPKQPYYTDNGEPYIPFTTPYKASFICTGYTDFDKFMDEAGEKTSKRITDALKVYNKNFTE